MQRLTTDEFIQRASVVHTCKYLYDNTVYVRNRDKIIITCTIHGNFEQTPFDHLHAAGCPQCGDLVNKYSTEDFITISAIRHNNYYDYSLTKYTGVRNKVTIICPKHGEFVQTADNHIRGKRCVRCSNSISKSENEWLDYMDIPDANRQVRLQIGNRYYKVDGFIKETNTVYEFWGDYWHGNPEMFAGNKLNKHNKKTFGELHEATQSKKRDLQIAGYKIIDIWEKDWLMHKLAICDK